MNEIINQIENIKIKNRGTGAGGRNTNKNGKYYENIKDINLETIIVEKKINHNIISFNKDKNKKFITGKKSDFLKFLDKYEDKKIERLHGTKNPDNWYIYDDNIFIIEIKFQQCGGSVCEKLQTAGSKIKNFKKCYPNYNIHYIYCLSKWFEKNCKGEILDLIEDKIPIFWCDDINFKSNLVDYILKI